MKKRLLFILVLAFSFGCTGYSRDYSTPDSSEIFSHINGKNIKNIRAKGKVDSIMAGGRAKVKVFLLADSIGRLRFDAVTPPPMNSTVLLLTSDGTVFRAHDKDKNKFYQGKSDACSVKNMLGISLEVKILFRLLTGKLPTDKLKASVEWDKKCGCEKLLWENNGKKTAVWIDGKNGKKHWKIVKVEIGEGKNKIRVEYRGYKKFDGKLLPSRVRISKPGTKNDTIFSWKKVEVDVEIDDEAWNQEIPENIPVYRMICPPGDSR
ncbi:MAG: DUF4292 domain-containing protein [Deltaproteobacteria bacterium]|nr:DUF4292 domain-containing protein [Deltaproteobacteria bacterium]